MATHAMATPEAWTTCLETEWPWALTIPSVEHHPRDTLSKGQTGRAWDRQTSGSSLDLGVEAGRVGRSQCAPGADLMRPVSPIGTKLLIPQAPEFVSPDLVCALHSNTGDNGKGHDEGVTT